jgi:hypothetical protein
MIRPLDARSDPYGLSKFIFLFALGFLVLSKNACANPVYDPMGFASFLYFIILIIFILNFPMNLSLYLVALMISMPYQSRKHFYVNPLGQFLNSAILITVIGTGFGAVIDVLFILMVSPSSFGLTIPIALMLIFLSFMFLARVFQKLPITTSILIATLITVFNAFAWWLVLATPTIALLIISSGFFAAVIIIPVFRLWYTNKRQRYSRIRRRTSPNRYREHIIKKSDIRTLVALMFIVLSIIILFGFIVAVIWS